MGSPPPTDVWLDHRLVVQRSPIEGFGLFFTDTVAAGVVPALQARIDAS